MEATMIDKKMCDKGLQIEVSCGNANVTRLSTIVEILKILIQNFY